MASWKNGSAMTLPKTISEYIRTEPNPKARAELKRLRAVILGAAPDATEKIAWRMPTFVQDGNLCHLAAFKDHISLFPGADAIAHFKRDLTPFKTSKGTIQFPYGAPAPATLIRRIVKFCVRRNLMKVRAKATVKR